MRDFLGGVFCRGFLTSEKIGFVWVRSVFGVSAKNVVSASFARICSEFPGGKIGFVPQKKVLEIVRNYPK